MALEQLLSSYSLETRLAALDQLVEMADASAVDCRPPSAVANMHCHTFFSFNAYGHSPSSLAWLARRRGYSLMGTVDFDVLDAVEEFLTACDRAGVRGSAGLETWVYIPQFATREINSPGEPGVYYHMGIGFVSGAAPDGAAPILADMRERAARRNRDMSERINAYLDPVRIDYDRDVLPLTPAGNATERHMLVAYTRAAERTVTDLAAFWSLKLNVPVDQIGASLPDPAKFQNLVRARLMKRGGAGYVQPGADSFPTLGDVQRMILACEALPCATWLDGTSAGEQDIQELLGLMIGHGAVALNIIPDRNWNIADADTRRIKVQKLYDIAQVASDLDLPLNVGTEMNASGQKLIDDFDAPELAPVRQAFLDGAHFIYGHTLLARALKMGYQSGWAKKHLPARRQRNAFYTAAGYRFPPGRAGLDRLAKCGPQNTPDEIMGA